MSIYEHPRSVHPRNHKPAWQLSRRGLLEASLATGIAVVATPVSGRRSQALAESSTPTAGNDLDAMFAEFDDFLSTRMTELNVPGVAAGVIAGDREHTAAFGITNVEHPLPVDTDTLFQIGSTTKTITGTTIMRLVEQGKLDLEVPVQTYLPDFRVADAEVSAKVTLRHLVTHTAGWFDNALNLETGDGDDALARYVEQMAELPQVTALGQYFSYNNGAVSLAGHVIESVTGQTYEAAVGELVLEPLGMDSASFFPEEIITEAVAAGHSAPPSDPSGTPVVVTPWALPRLANPAGGLVSTLNDQLRYARFHLGDGTVNGAPVLIPDSLKQMRTPLGPGGTVPELAVDHVGVNWMLRNRGGATVISHAGGTYGQQSDFCLVPERSFAVTTLTNSISGAVLAIGATDWALERFLGLPRPDTMPVSLSPDQLDAYTGEYVLPENGGTIRVTVENGQLGLMMLVPGQPEPAAASPLQLIGDDLATVEYLGFPIFTDFVRDETGAVAWIRYFGRMTPRAA